MTQQYENQVRNWGFDTVFTWTDVPNYHYEPHSHQELTTHLIIAGEMTVWYPLQEKQKVTYGPGARVDVEAGVVHEVWIGPSGCTYVIGELVDS